MSIVIPVAVEGLHVASRAGGVATRRGGAVRVAERLLNESIITTNWSRSSQSGTAYEDDRQYRWNLRNEIWNQDPNQTTLRLLTVEVYYAVQNQEYEVRLSTLVNNSTQ